VVATPIRGRLLKPKVVRRWARQRSYSLTLRELAREYRKAPPVGGLRIGSSFFRTYTVEHSRKGAPVVNIKRGLMRLWIFASIGWVAFVGGMTWRTLPEHIPLWEALIPPIGILGIGWTLAWFVRGFRRPIK
jgi:hypothetical protein